MLHTQASHFPVLDLLCFPKALLCLQTTFAIRTSGHYMEPFRGVNFLINESSVSITPSAYSSVAKDLLPTQTVS